MVVEVSIGSMALWLRSPTSTSLTRVVNEGRRVLELVQRLCELCDFSFRAFASIQQGEHLGLERHAKQLHSST